VHRGAGRAKSVRRAVGTAGGVRRAVSHLCICGVVCLSAGAMRGL